MGTPKLAFRVRSSVLRAGTHDQYRSQTDRHNQPHSGSLEQRNKCLAVFEDWQWQILVIVVIAVVDTFAYHYCDCGSSRFCGCFTGEARVPVAAVVVAAGVVEG